MGHLQEAFQDLRGNSFRILLYHSISDKADYPYTVSPDEFAWQMTWLCKHKFTVTSLENVLSNNIQCIDNKSRLVVITFDDGYEDNYTNVLPIMEKHGYKATFFIATGFVGDYNRWEDPALPRLKMMNWEQIEDLSRRGHIIGGHTHGHINLAATDTAKVKDDLSVARKLLFDKIKYNFIPFAYPFGKYNQAIIDQIKQDGYSCAVSAGGFWGNNPQVSHWELRREDIHRDTGRLDFIAQMRGAKNFNYWKMGLKFLRK